jgi:hypothetical protein
MTPLTQFLTLLAAWIVAGVATVLAGWYGAGFILLPVIWWALVLRGSPERAVVAEQKLQSTLMKHETVIASGLQLRVGALLRRRALIALTSSRVVVISRSLLGGFTMRDHQWKDLRDATLSENILPGIFGSRLGLGAAGAAVAVDALPSDTAARMYAHAQSEEQAWEEKQRVRSLEEKRATSGGVIVGSGVGAGAGGGGTSSMLEELDRAKKLFDSGAISDAEYQELKSKILNRQAF